MSVANLRTGAAAQFGFATNALHDNLTIVTPNTFLPFLSESIQRQVATVRVASISAGIGPRSEDVMVIPYQRSTGARSHAILTKGYARLLRHWLYGYSFSWPGSTDADAELTLAAVLTDGDTMTIGSQTYTFVDALTASTTANEILIAATIALQCSYIEAAINRGTATDGNGSGVAYGSLTPRNADVDAVAAATTVTVTDRQGRGTGANTVATTETFADVNNVFDSATLNGGVDGTDAARLHTVTIDPEAFFETLATVQEVRAPSNAPREQWNYVGKIVSGVLSFAADNVLMFDPTWDMLSEERSTAIATPSYPTDARMFNYSQIIAEIDDVAEPVQGASVTFNSGQEPRTQAGTTVLRPHLITGEATITGELTREFENADIYDDWVAGTDAKIEMIATGGTIPSSASTYQLAVTMPACRYLGSTPNTAGLGVTQNNIPFEVLRDGVNEWMTVTYRTDETYAGDDGA